MEEDDDFGDLYSDVLPPFQSPAPAPPQSKPQIDLNTANSDDEEILFGAPNPNSSSDQLARVPPEPQAPAIRLNLNLNMKLEDQVVKKEEELGPPRVSQGSANESSESKTNSSNNNRVKVEPVVVKEEITEDFDKFDIEEAAEGEIGGTGPEPVIPGLSSPVGKSMIKEEEDDWDSDSEDDLQIVLDDDKNRGMMGMNATGSDDEDEDGGPLVILEPSHQPMEEGGAGERKEGGEAAGKVIGGVGMKIGYSGHAYHPYHSQFKYVRPGAAPIPGAAPVGPEGAPGQVRPSNSMIPVGGRGRGEWRPPGMKGFHSGFAWGNNALGRGFGIGLDFTLPSHKTIFEVDVDGFEEKPWKLSGIDVSDFFNFGMNEESWKDYCKQLEQHRLETSMQSKIRVYESGRTEQDYDPDLPPELAAATGVKDNPSENANVGKMDAGDGDLVKEFGTVRPQLPIGRPIQVETGSGERLPSIDTRPPRLRDSDAIIEIILQGLENDDSLAEDEAIEQLETDTPKKVVSGGGDEIEEEDGDRCDMDTHAYSGRKRDDMTERNGTKPFIPEVQNDYSPNNRGHSSYPEKEFDVLHEERRLKDKTRDRSLNITHSGSTLDRRKTNSQKEGSVESVGGKRSSRLSSSPSGGTDEELDVEHVDSHDELIPVRKERGSDAIPSAAEAYTDENPSSYKKQKISPRFQKSPRVDVDYVGDIRATKTAENRNARSESERDYQKSRGSVEEELRRGRPKNSGNFKRPYDDDEHFVKNSYEEKFETGRHRLVETSREDQYSYRDWDPHGRKERDNTRKRVLVEEMGSRHRTKVHESERLDKDEHFKLKKQMENGGSRGYYDKEIGSQHRGRDDNIKSRFDTMDDPYRKRRKEEEYMRRDVEKEEMYLGHREYTHHRKREREDAMDLRKSQVRSRDEGHHSVRYKEDDWALWERSERHRTKQSYEESLPKRERVEVRDGLRSSRAVEDKAWAGQARLKDKGSERDYQFKDIGRQSDQHKKRDSRVEDVGLLHHRGSEDVHVRGDQLINDERKLKQERARTRSDLVSSRVHHKKHKESTRKGKEYEGGEQKSMTSLKRNQEDDTDQVKERVMSKGTIEQGKGENEILPNHQSSRKRKEDGTASTDDEQQDSRKGRSKLERWTSHKEREFTINNKKPSSSSLKVLETDNCNNDMPASASKNPDENSLPSDPQGVGVSENKNVESRPMENKHLDTVEKLKKRSERFKLPMPSEKEVTVIKKMENEPLPSVQEEAPPASEIKPERPARKRRWISS